MTKVALALGGNVGNTAEVFNKALTELGNAGFEILAVSSFIVTKPVGCFDGTADFLNGALIGEWKGQALELLGLTHGLERKAGRPVEHDSRASRVLDIDILLWGNENITGERLTIPHPRMHLRRFVLEPLAEIAGEWFIPGQNCTVREALERL